MPKVAVLTVSKRTGWEHNAEECLNWQIFQNFEWVVVTEDKYSHSCLQFINGHPTKHIYAPKKTRVSNLNASLNEGLSHCLDTDYVIFYQDFIDLPPDCFQKLVDVAEQTGMFVTTATINHDGTMDGRYTGTDEVHPCEPSHWEANVAIAPMKAIKELGGFDEEYDNGWSWDNVNLAERARLLGYKFCIDESNKPQLLYHPKEPDVNPDLKPNGDLHAKLMEHIRSGAKPIRLNYLYLRTKSEQIAYY